MYTKTKDYARTVLNKAGIELGEQMMKTLDIYLTIRRLAKKHHRLAEMSCNGYGYIKGQSYYNGSIDAYARREYGSNVKSAYMPQEIGLGDEETIFDLESCKVEYKIKSLCDKIGFSVEFQGDPRGNTVKLSYNGSYVEVF